MDAESLTGRFNAFKDFSQILPSLNLLKVFNNYYQIKKLCTFIYYMSNLDTEIIDFIDLINFTLSEQFVDKWKFRFSPKFMKEFQNKIIKSLKDRKPIKLKTLSKYLIKKCGYSIDQLENFFGAIDISIYYPLIIN